jgi:hypothetical protein
MPLALPLGTPFAFPLRIRQFSDCFLSIVRDVDRFELEILLAGEG